MTLPFLWPKEFQTYYWRLEPNYRQLIISNLEKNYHEGVDILTNFLEAMNHLLTIDGLYLRNSEFLFLSTAILQIQGKTDEVIELSKKDEFHPGLLNAKAYALISQRKFDDVTDIVENAQKCSMDTDGFNSLFALSNKILCYYYSQQFDSIPEAILRLLEEYQAFYQKNESNPHIIIALKEARILGESVTILLNRRKGELEEGFNKGYELIREIRETENRYILNRLLNNTAICLIESGKLKDGLSLLVEAFSFSEIIANELQLAIGANNIGFIYRTMGDLEKSMKYFFIALDNAKKAKVAPYIVATETNIAHLHLDFGNPTMALSDSEDALKSLEKSDVPIPHRIQVALDLCRADIFETMDRFDDASETLKHAINLIEDGNLNAELPKVYLRQARLSARQSNLGEATKLLEKAHSIALNNSLFEIIVNAKLQLAEIDLLKYRMTNEKVLLLNALEKISDSKQLCLEQDYILILIDTLILEGLLLSLNGKQKDGKKILEEAIEYAKTHNLPEKEREAKNQLGEIGKEKKNLLVRIFTRINESIRSSISFESAAKPKILDSDPRAMYIVSKKSGLNLFQKKFSEEHTIDSNLLSGLLSAIRAMGEEVLSSKEGGLKLIDHGDVAIMLETGKKFFIALVAPQETYILREKLRLFSNSIDKNKTMMSIDESIMMTDPIRNEIIEKLIAEHF